MDPGGHVQENAPEDLDLHEAAVHVGMSPTSFAALVDRGVVPSHPSDDGRSRRIRVADLDEHRRERFELRQHLAQLARDRRHTPYGPQSNTADVVISPEGPAADVV